MFYKDEVVKMMTDYVNEMNRKGMIDMGILPSQIEEVIQPMQIELQRVNGEIYDMLKENGVIA